MGLKNSVLDPFIRIEVDVAEIQDMIRFIRSLGKFKKVSESLMKDYSILSKTFSRFILIIIFPFSPLVLLK